MMLTYNVGIGMKSPQVLSMVQEKATPKDFIKHFQQSELHHDAFDDFWRFLVALAEKLRFKTIGASTELSEHAECPGRVHLHAYLGTSVKGGVAAMCSIVRSDIVESDLVYVGVKPFPRPTKPRKTTPRQCLRLWSMGFITSLQTKRHLSCGKQHFGTLRKVAVAWRLLLPRWLFFAGRKIRPGFGHFVVRDNLFFGLLSLGSTFRTQSKLLGFDPPSYRHLLRIFLLVL